MNTDSLRPLFFMALQNPRQAAERSLALGPSPQSLWMLLALTAIVTALLASLQALAAPLSPDEIRELAQTAEGQQQLMVYAMLTQSPLVLALIVWGLSVITVFMLYWAGKALGGQGRLVDVLCIFTLLQAVSLVISGALAVANVVIPALAGLGTLVFMVWSLWAITNFLDVAHQYENILKAFGVLIATVFGTLMGVLVIVTIIGGLAAGIVGAG